jgi:hypothetical protein
MTPFAKDSDFEAAVLRDPSVDPYGADYQEWGLKIFPQPKSERPR